MMILTINIIHNINNNFILLLFLWFIKFIYGADIFSIDVAFFSEIVNNFVEEIAMNHHFL